VLDSFNPYEGPLILIGYWSGPQTSAGWPDVHDFVDEAWDEQERQDVGSYLKHGLVARAFMGYSRCRFCEENNGSLELTDGVYLWPQGLAHYVLEHGVRLPDVFVRHVDHQADLEEGLTVDNTWWRGLTSPRS
jgi:hypothetical protein